MVSFSEWQCMDIRVAEIKQAEKVEGADKLLKLTVELGDEERTLVAGIAAEYQPDEIIGKKILVLANLDPKVLKGIESKGMILAAVDEGRPILLNPEKDVPSGTKVM